MKQGMADGRMRVCIVAMVFLFMLITVVQAEARQDSLKTELRNNGISMKLVRLDRTDGFMFGLSFTGPQKRSIVIAPGFDRMFLVVADAQEIILQADGTGKLQIIQALPVVPPIWVACWYQALLDLENHWTSCQGLWVCQISSLITLFTDIFSVIDGTSACLTAN